MEELNEETMDPLAKVLFYEYPSHSLVPGGGQVQLSRTFQALRTLGVNVSLFNAWSTPDGVGILHVFGSEYFNFEIVRVAKTLGWRVVISPIFFAQNERVSRLWGAIDQFLPLRTSFGLRRDLLRMCDAILPNSCAELEQLCRIFGVDRRKCFVIPNAAEARFAEASPELFAETYGLKDFVLSVGRIEPRKNQLRLVQAIGGSKIPLVLIGEKVDQHYAVRVLREAGKFSNIYYLGEIDHEDELLASAYAAARVHVLASLVETPGIANLEAALAGCSVVSPDVAPAREYFCGYAHYCDPLDIKSIRLAVQRAFDAGNSDELRKHVLACFTWERSAKLTVQVYEEILKDRQNENSC